MNPCSRMILFIYSDRWVNDKQSQKRDMDVINIKTIWWKPCSNFLDIIFVATGVIRVRWKLF